MGIHSATVAASAPLGTSTETASGYSSDAGGGGDEMAAPETGGGALDGVCASKRDALVGG
jgi:hypothetical protein